ncbi:bacterial Ig-like domain-containing protein [Enterococcus faecalis]|uniref:bacterial Ig-like domain-containing protein n=1 Tax=Enterococcus faecalis TaxID=1351 RepID=UPI004042F287
MKKRTIIFSLITVILVNTVVGPGYVGARTTVHADELVTDNFIDYPVAPPPIPDEPTNQLESFEQAQSGEPVSTATIPLADEKPKENDETESKLQETITPEEEAAAADILAGYGLDLSSILNNTQDLPPVMNRIGSIDPSKNGGNVIVDAEGDLGTVHWYLKDGVLHISGGVLPNNLRTSVTPAIYFDAVYTDKLGPFTVVDLNAGTPGSWTYRYPQIQRVIFDGNVVAGSSLGWLFMGLTKLTQIDHLERLDTTNVTNMDWMFAVLSSLTSLDVSSFNTANVTSMRSMFQESGLTSLDLSNFNTANVTDFYRMFYRMLGLKSLDLSSFNTTNGTKFFSFFQYDSHLEHIKLGPSFYISPLMILNGNSPTLSQGTWLGNGWRKNMVGLSYGDIRDVIQLSDGAAKAGDWYYSCEPTLTTRDTSLYVGESWDPNDNFVSATDETRAKNPLLLTSIAVNSTVNTAVPGTYPVIYSYYGLSRTAYVTVVPDNTTINLKSMQINLYVGDTWSPQDNFISAIDKYGHVGSYNQVAIIGAVNLNAPGVYPITYDYGSVTRTINVTVVPDQTAINLKTAQMTLYTSDTWQAQEQFIDAKNRDGNTVPYDQISVSGTVNLTTPGVYPVTYAYGSVTRTINVTVVPDQTAVNLKSTQVNLYSDDTWQPQEHFIDARDRDGNDVPYDQVSVSGTVDPHTLGVYPVIYTYGSASRTINVKVLQNPSYALQLPARLRFSQTNEPKVSQTKGADTNYNIKLLNTADGQAYAGNSTIQLTVTSQNHWQLKGTDNSFGANYKLKDMNGQDITTVANYSFNLDRVLNEKTLVAYLTNKADKSGTYSDVVTFNYQRVP